MTHPKHENWNRARATKPLPEVLNRDLRRYAEAAASTAVSNRQANVSTAIAIGALGLGVLALPELSDARVIFTPTNQTINEQQRRLKIDINHDGLAVASFYVGGYCLSGSGAQNCFGTIYANGLSGNQVMASSQQQFASAARLGKVIGSNDVFKVSEKMADCRAGFNTFFHTSFQTSHGPWRDVNARYVGFQFQKDGQAHYGWARMNVTGFPCHPSATLTGYAYETEAGKPIVAGVIRGSAEALMEPRQSPEKKVGVEGMQNPASLGALAIGAGGLAAWRRETD